MPISRTTDAATRLWAGLLALLSSGAAGAATARSSETPHRWHPLRDDRGDVPGWVMITMMTA